MFKVTLACTLLTITTGMLAQIRSSKQSGTGLMGNAPIVQLSPSTFSGPSELLEAKGKGVGAERTGCLLQRRLPLSVSALLSAQ